MYLKALTLRGFKSFASATTLRLEPGITCVVGPNGSGKSNVVDALSWVMGEQGAKSLRGANMSDVIFAGTSGRSPLGRAQVELTIDNSDGRLPIEYSEVTISRTLFRGGGSEYTINGTAVRLLDVQELLSDTGMGKQMHVIVGQGQLDAVLRSTPEERRGFIDEAAGVLKHRRRKERALRKLEAMDANLVRVLDLTEEIRRQLRPLARQAKAAREAAGVQERIDYAQRRLTADDLITSRRRMERDRAEAERARTAAAGHDVRIAELRQRVTTEQENGAGIQVDLQRYTEMWHQFDSLHERLSSVVDLSAERLVQAQPRGQQISEAQIELSEEKAAETAEAARAAEQTVAEQRSKADASASARAGIEREAERATRDLREREEALERSRREQAKVRESQVSAASLVEASRAAVSRAGEARAGAVARVEEARAEASESTAEAPPSDGESSLADRHARCIEQEQQARRALEDVQAAERDARAELARWQARRDALAGSLPKEQSGRSADAETWNSLGTLEQGLRVSRGWERAVSALLIPFEQAPVIADDSLERGIAHASDSGTALRAVTTEWAEIGDAPASPAPATARSLPAVEAVTASPAILPAVGELLGDAWLADSVEEARRILERGIVRTVATTDGLVLTPHSVRGPGEDAVSTLLIRTQWEDARDRAERMSADLADLTEKLATGREALNAAAGETAAALRLLREHDAEQARTAQARARVAARIGAAEDEQRRAEADVAAAQVRLAEAEARLAAAAEELGKLPILEAEPFLAEARRAVDEVAARVKAASEREMADRLALRGAEEQLRSATRQADAFRTQVEQLRQTRLEQGRREEVLFAARQRISQIKARADRAKTEALENAQAAKARKLELEEQSRQAGTRLLGLQRELEDLQWKQNHAGEARQQAEVALAGSSLLHDQHREKALELVRAPEGEESEQEGLLAELLAEYGPDQPVLDAEGSPQPYQRAAMVMRLDAAQKELSRLGVVNPLAVEEHAALTTRHDFLIEQVNDLKKSKSDLLAIIDDVDERVRDAFTDAFAETQAQFERVFGILFPGGRGHLSLTDPDDPLTTGVEIYARPAGKRVTRLSLLSGGERSLAALAFLVAIFQARPSPFYVMDEVEAALDDINLSRVLTVLEELRASSQLILITHQKRTMEIADALYGVSMRQGTTTVVSHRLKRDQ